MLEELVIREVLVDGGGVLDAERVDANLRGGIRPLNCPRDVVLGGSIGKFGVGGGGEGAGGSATGLREGLGAERGVRRG